MNKKCMIRLLFVICLASSIVACSDDNEKTGGSPEEITADYSNKLSAGENANLSLTYSGKELIGKNVRFETNDAKTAKITLVSILPHEAEALIENIALTDNGNNGYIFKGNNISALGTTYDYSGTVQKGNMSLDITNVKIPANSLGTLAIVLNDDSEATTETVDGKRHRYTTYHQALYLNTDNAGINSMELVLANVILGPLLKGVIKNITFNGDGNLTAMYAPLPEDFDFQKDIIQNGGINRTDNDWQTSPVNLVSYIVLNSKELYLTPNIDMITRQIQQDATSRSTGGTSEMTEALAQLNKWMSTGIKLTLKENPRKDFYIYKESASMTQHRKYEGNYVVYIDKEEIKPFVPLIKTLMPILLTPELIEQINQATGGMIDIENMINSILEAVEGAETLEIGLFLNKN